MRTTHRGRLILSPTAGAELIRWIPALPYGGCRVQVLALQEECNPRGTRVQPHGHSFFEALLILSGRGTDVSARRQPLRPGSVLLHPPQTPHAWEASGSETRYARIWFSVTPEPPTAIPAAWPCDTDAIRDYERLVAVWHSREVGRRERLTAGMTLLLAPFLAMLRLPTGADKPPPDAMADRSVAALVDLFIADNLQRPLSLRDVARQVNLSVTTLVRRIRQETGQSLKVRLRQRRMERAAVLLSGSAATIKEIAAAVGIPEPSYFCRCFRQAFGISPEAFRMREAAKAGARRKR
jgi:AraC-like DNA-binding protein/mannose-6-phosphate isomerase-like protein (cupin superfamily)